MMRRIQTAPQLRAANDGNLCSQTILFVCCDLDSHMQKRCARARLFLFVFLKLAPLQTLVVYRKKSQAPSIIQK